VSRTGQAGQKVREGQQHGWEAKEGVRAGSEGRYGWKGSRVTHRSAFLAADNRRGGVSNMPPMCPWASCSSTPSMHVSTHKVRTGMTCTHITNHKSHITCHIEHKPATHKHGPQTRNTQAHPQGTSTISSCRTRVGGSHAAQGWLRKQKCHSDGKVRVEERWDGREGGGGEGADVPATLGPHRSPKHNP
jgi:hypothetical protein